jgi:hypothetical protein
MEGPIYKKTRASGLKQRKLDLTERKLAMWKGILVKLENTGTFIKDTHG